MKKIVKRLYYFYVKRSNPMKYAKIIGVKMGKNTHIYGNVLWGSEPWLITLGDNVYITDGCKFITHDGGTLILRKFIPDLELTFPITIKNDVYIGVNTIILPGITIGNNCIIGAGSVVTKDIPDNSVFAGVPAKHIKSTQEYLDKIKSKSLGFGHLNSIEKEKKLKKYYNII